MSETGDYGPAGTPAAGSTRERLIAAALGAFSEAGFDGVSVRRVERAAGVERGLVAYHFGSKQNLWNEAVDSLFFGYLAEIGALRTALRDVSARDRGRALTMAYTRFNAAHPELYRLLVLEGLSKTERSERLGGHLRRAEDVFREILGLRRADGDAALDATIVVYLILAAAGAPFAMPAYRDQLVGPALRPDAPITHPDFVEPFAEALAAIAVNGVPLRRGAQVSTDRAQQASSSSAVITTQ